MTVTLHVSKQFGAEVETALLSMLPDVFLAG